MSTAPADLVALAAKGRLGVGADADLVVFAPGETFTVRAGALLHKNPISAYDGAELRGVARRVWLRGTEVGTTAGAPASGRLLDR